MRPGYKQTEIGIIPDDWSIDALGNNCDLVTKGTTPTSIGRAFKISGINFLKAESISDAGRPILDKVARIDTLTHSLLKRSQLRANDVLVSIAGVLGRVGMVEVADLPANVNQALAIIRLSAQSRIAREFVFYVLRSASLTRQIRDISVQAAQANISLQDVSEFLLPVPPLPEQRAIAAALRNVDALLDSLERLIAKKRDLKQAAMQQLLTGQTRLPGFHGEWRIAKLGDVIQKCFSGATPRRSHPEFYKGDVRWITSGELNYNTINDTVEKISRDAVVATNLAIIPVGTFLMAITGLEAEGTRGACGIVGAPSTTNQSCMAVFPAEALRTDYLYHYYVYRGKQLALQYCQGTKQQSYTAALVKQLPIELPPTTNEQTAIAAVLSDMDAELSALEARRDKTRDIKQAMMQELLTGRIRLV